MTVLALAVTGRGLVDPVEPVIRADDEGLLRGRAAFETLKVYGGRPFRLEAHLDRLTASAASIGLPAVERRRIQVLVGLVLPKAASGDASLRLVWTAGPARGAPSALALLSDIPDWIEPARERGACCRLASRRQSIRAVASPGSQVDELRGEHGRRGGGASRGVDEALFVDGDGIVLEGTVTNVWWRVGDTLFTPALDLGILAGVTRATLVELAPQCGFSVEEGAYPLARLLESEEAFTSSSVREVMPLVEVDGRRSGAARQQTHCRPRLRDLAAKV
jgi:branched-subunit amino acid aminotransferase/4-amino-4-deoxychorismate lyase